MYQQCMSLHHEKLEMKPSCLENAKEEGAKGYEGGDTPRPPFTYPAVTGARSAVRETIRHEEEASLRDVRRREFIYVLRMPHGGLAQRTTHDAQYSPQ